MKIYLKLRNSFNGKATYRVEVIEDGFQMLKDIEVNENLTQSEVITKYVIPQFNDYKAYIKPNDPAANHSDKEKELKLTEDEKWEWINVAQERMKSAPLIHATQIADKFIEELRKRL